MTQEQSQYILVAITILIFVPLLYYRLRRTMRPRPLQLKRLWIRPLLFVAIAAAVLASAPLQPGDGYWLGGAACVGGITGWLWGKMMTIETHPENGTLMVQGSQAAMIVFVVLLFVRVGLRTGLQMESNALHLTPAFITDVFIVFAAALFGMQTLEMFLRARRVLARGKSPAEGA